MLSKKLKSVARLVKASDPSSPLQLPKSVEKEAQPGPPEASWATASPEALKETQTPRDLFLNLNSSASKSIKSKIISLKRTALLSLHFILSA